MSSDYTSPPRFDSNTNAGSASSGQPGDLGSYGQRGFFKADPPWGDPTAMSHHGTASGSANSSHLERMLGNSPCATRGESSSQSQQHHLAYDSGNMYDNRIPAPPNPYSTNSWNPNPASSLGWPPYPPTDNAYANPLGGVAPTPNLGNLSSLGNSPNLGSSPNLGNPQVPHSSSSFSHNLYSTGISGTAPLSGGSTTSTSMNHNSFFPLPPQAAPVYDEPASTPWWFGTPPSFGSSSSSTSSSFTNPSSSASKTSSAQNSITTTTTSSSSALPPTPSSVSSSRHSQRTFDNIDHQQQHHSSSRHFSNSDGNVTNGSLNANSRGNSNNSAGSGVRRPEPLNPHMGAPPSSGSYGAFAPPPVHPSMQNQPRSLTPKSEPSHSMHSTPEQQQQQHYAPHHASSNGGLPLQHVAPSINSGHQLHQQQSTQQQQQQTTQQQQPPSAATNIPPPYSAPYGMDMQHYGYRQQPIKREELSPYMHQPYSPYPPQDPSYPSPSLYPPPPSHYSSMYGNSPAHSHHLHPQQQQQQQQQPSSQQPQQLSPVKPAAVPSWAALNQTSSFFQNHTTGGMQPLGPPPSGMGGLPHQMGMGAPPPHQMSPFMPPPQHMQPPMGSLHQQQQQQQGFISHSGIMPPQQQQQQHGGSMVDGQTQQQQQQATTQPQDASDKKDVKEENDDKEKKEDDSKEKKDSKKMTKEEKKAEKKRQREEKKNLRKNIKEVKDQATLDENTRNAQQAEQERQRRLHEARQRALAEQLRSRVPQPYHTPMSSMMNIVEDTKVKAEPQDDVGSTDDTSMGATVKTAPPSSSDDSSSDTDTSTSSIDEAMREKRRRRREKKKRKKDVIDISSGDEASAAKRAKEDVVLVSDDDDDNDDDDKDDKDDDIADLQIHLPDAQGRVMVNLGHPDDDPDIFLAPQLASIVKPHQIGGIRFLFDNVVESVKRFNTTSGFGCILAHSMGLGKTLQVISFIDILQKHIKLCRKVLCIVPINTIQNWQAEFDKWVPMVQHIHPSYIEAGQVRPREYNVYLLNEGFRTNAARADVISDWDKNGGVLLMGYEMYRLLAQKKSVKPKSRRNAKNGSPRKEESAEDKEKTTKLLEGVYAALVNPGPDLVICDEGHRIKNCNAATSNALKEIKTKRRVVLTGYPLQNNLLEYWCMVDFVRPSYLGTRSEFTNMFERPIQNGQCMDSTPKDRQLMKFRAHVLHSLLQGFVQRRGHAVLKASLPQKEEHVLMVRMTTIQRTLYSELVREFLTNSTGTNPLKFFAVCCKIWNHPDILYNLVQDKKALAGIADMDLDIDLGTTSCASKTSNGPIGENDVGLVNGDATEGDSKAACNGGGSLVQNGGGAMGEKGVIGGAGGRRRKTESAAAKRRAAAAEKNRESVNNSDEEDTSNAITYDWAYPLLQDYEPGKLEHSHKFVLLFRLIDEALLAGDKILVFSQSLLTLDLIEKFLAQVEMPMRPGFFYQDRWQKSRTYFRLDGSTSAQEREKLINEFNNNPNVCLFLLSTRAGCLGINLIGANRIVVVDASWNPCHDAQAVCRIYRYGQQKSCHIYRLVCDNSLEKRIYDRQVNKQGMSDRVVDELNPESTLAWKDLSTLIQDNEKDPPPQDLSAAVEKFTDPAMKAIVEFCSEGLAKEPFQHESLLSDRKDQKLTKMEKRLAKQSYEMEKRAAAHGGFSARYNQPLTTPAMIQSGIRQSQWSQPGYMPGRNMYMGAQVQQTPLPQQPQNAVLQTLLRQGMTVQRMKVPTKISIPLRRMDSSGGEDTDSDGGLIPPTVEVEAGTDLLVMKTPKGIYLRLPEGRVMAIKMPGSGPLSTDVLPEEARINEIGLLRGPRRIGTIGRGGPPEVITIDEDTASSGGSTPLRGPASALNSPNARSSITEISDDEETDAATSKNQIPTITSMNATETKDGGAAVNIKTEIDENKWLAAERNESEGRITNAESLFAKETLDDLDDGETAYFDAAKEAEKKYNDAGNVIVSADRSNCPPEDGSFLTASKSASASVSSTKGGRLDVGSSSSATTTLSTTLSSDLMRDDIVMSQASSTAAGCTTTTTASVTISNRDSLSLTSPTYSASSLPPTPSALPSHSSSVSPLPSSVSSSHSFSSTHHPQQQQASSHHQSVSSSSSLVSSSVSTPMNASSSVSFATTPPITSSSGGGFSGFGGSERNSTIPPWFQPPPPPASSSSGAHSWNMSSAAAAPDNNIKSMNAPSAWSPLTSQTMTATAASTLSTSPPDKKKKATAAPSTSSKSRSRKTPVSASSSAAISWQPFQADGPSRGTSSEADDKRTQSASTTNTSSSSKSSVVSSSAHSSMPTSSSSFAYQQSPLMNPPPTSSAASSTAWFDSSPMGTWSSPGAPPTMGVPKSMDSWMHSAPSDVTSRLTAPYYDPLSGPASSWPGMPPPLGIPPAAPPSSSTPGSWYGGSAPYAHPPPPTVTEAPPYWTSNASYQQPPYSVSGIVPPPMTTWGHQQPPDFNPHHRPLGGSEGDSQKGSSTVSAL